MLLANLMLVLTAGVSPGATTQKHYYAHEAVEDSHGVIAPWYHGQDGQLGHRVRIGAETLKRYPWADASKAAAVAPEYLWSSFWHISDDGQISVPMLSDWMNGDRGQLAKYVLLLMPAYYRYSDDPVAIAHALMEADIVLNYGLTDSSNPWPRFPVSVPTKGKPYGQCDPRGFIQLDMAAWMGYGFLKTYQLTGESRLFEAAKHWGDVFADKYDRTPGAAPWGRYANPESILGTNFIITDADNAKKLTGGVVWITYFLDELIRLGYSGDGGKIVEARNAARNYLRDVLLPAWTVNDTWGRHYWDWDCPVQVGNMTAFAAIYMMDNKSSFPNWRNDARNILSLCLNRVCVNPESNGDVYSGAWAAPESCVCCGRCLSATPLLMAEAWARYGVETNSEWARDIVRRMMILVTYDLGRNGNAEDNIDGGWITNGEWFESAHMAPMMVSLDTISWLPDVLGASREDHIVRSSAVVNNVQYGKGRLDYSTFDAPENTVDMLRLSYSPDSVSANDVKLRRRSKLDGNGYTVKALSNGDCILTVRHDGYRDVVVRGSIPQRVSDDDDLQFFGSWIKLSDAKDYAGGARATDQSGASAALKFRGNQVRLIGRCAQDGGLADVYIDGVKQLAGIDYWNPQGDRQQQVLYYTSGLSNDEHEIKIVARGEGNPRSGGRKVYVDSIQWSDATGDDGFGEGGGPKDAQRMIFGYTSRQDYIDSAGNAWKPGCEFVVRSGGMTDSVAASWWTEPVAESIGNTEDPALYRYGIHAPRLNVNLTVGPGQYHVWLKFAATRGIDTKKNCITVFLNGRRVVSRMDVAATGGGPNKAVDLVFNLVNPRNGVIEIKLVGDDPASGKPGEAFIQAVEIGPGQADGHGATPVCVAE